MKDYKTPITLDDLKTMKAGDVISITGVIYTGRDAAHKRMVDLIKNNEKIPFELESNVIYYVGPSPTKPGDVIGSAGPTSSYRMDKYSPTMIKYGLNVMIGKGPRDKAFKDALPLLNGVYLSAIGGAAALISSHIIKSEVIAFDDLGAEAVHKFTVDKFPAIVTYDLHGNDLLEDGIKTYKNPK